MPQTVRLLNWNIQNYGKTKAQYSDIVDGIAKMVVLANPVPDIFVLVELNTSKEATAQDLSKRLAVALNAQSIKLKGRDEFKVYVLSPNTGIEYYAFFVRNAALTKPLIPVNTKANTPPYTIGGGGPDYLTAVVFKEQKLTGKMQLIERFALYEPDIDIPVTLPSKKKAKALPTWPATRLPVLGMFWCATAGRLLPIFACHYAAKHSLARKQFNTLKYFSLLDGMAPSAAAGSAPKGIPVLKVQFLGKGTQNVTPGTYVMTGDFNLDYTDPTEQGAYNVIQGNAAPNLAAAVQNTAGDTLYMTYGVFTAKRPKTVDQLPNRDYDNYCLRVSPTAGFTVTPSDITRYQTAEAIRTRFIKLWESVDAYKELDKRGFISNQYADIAKDFASQIGGDKSHLINLAGSLVGGRLVSDHLSVAITLTIT